jgi:hypothetical protein
MPGGVAAPGRAAEYEVASDETNEASLAGTLRQESPVARPYQSWPDQARAVCGVSAAMYAKAENTACSTPMSVPKVSTVIDIDNAKARQ